MTASTMIAQRPVSRAARVAAWIPALLLIGAGLLTAVGISLVPRAHATSANVTPVITVVVDKEVHVAYSVGNCGSPDGTLDAGTLTVSMNDTSLGTCRVTFGSNNNGASGAVLNIANSNAGANTFFCTRATYVGACGAGVFNDGSGADMAEGTVGGKLSASSGCTTSNWAGNYSQVLSAGTNVCATTSTADGDYTMQFGADPAATQLSGTYRGQATVTATAS